MKLIVRDKTHKETQWIPISDMMTGLMMVFLFIAVVYMVSVKSIAKTYDDLQGSLYEDLYKEFKDDLVNWNADIDRTTLSIYFNEPSILFASNSATLKHGFKIILNDFYPRYIKILTSKRYADAIDEARIEGHTSSEWYGTYNTMVGYLENMRLSQERTRSVLSYIMNIPSMDVYHKWMINHVTANGLSYSRRRYDVEGNEDYQKSRRVEFRIKTKAEESIKKMLGKSQNI